MSKKVGIKGYRYYLQGGFWTPQKKYFSIEIEIPTIYKGYGEAINNKVSAYFRKLEGHINLVIHEEDKILDTIEWDEWWRYKIAEQKEEAYRKVLIDCRDFIPNSTNWDILFEIEKIEDNWSEGVELLSYCINPILNK